MSNVELESSRVGRYSKEGVKELARVGVSETAYLSRQGAEGTDDFGGQIMMAVDGSGVCGQHEPRTNDCIWIDAGMDTSDQRDLG